jgi:hypothetical protein
MLTYLISVVVFYVDILLCFYISLMNTTVHMAGMPLNMQLAPFGASGRQAIKHAISPFWGQRPVGHKTYKPPFQPPFKLINFSEISRTRFSVSTNSNLNSELSVIHRKLSVNLSQIYLNFCSPSIINTL